MSPLSSISKWIKGLIKALTPWERYSIIVLLLLILGSLVFLGTRYYLEHTTPIPARGGLYTEGIVGKPRYINPILAQISDADRDLSELIFSGLMKYDKEGKLKPDLAKKYEIGEDGKTYIFYLREDVKWHNGIPLNAQDVAFTIQRIQDPDYKSPLRINWQGVTVETPDDFTIRFKLKNIYAPFLENTTVGILPKHLWEGISANNFPLAEGNLKPVGSGPYKFAKLQKDTNGSIKSYLLESNLEYYSQKPFIEKIRLRFYPDEDSAIAAYNRKEVDGLSFLSAQKRSQIKSRENLNIYSLNIPRFFAVFFNQTQSKILTEKKVRLALAYATNKEEIITEVLKGEGFIVHSPILPNLLGYTEDVSQYEYDPEKAKAILEEEGWKDLDEDGIREKQDPEEETIKKLEIFLITTQWPELQEVAHLLEDQWSKVGIKTSLEILGISQIQKEYIQPRKYQALLFGEVLGWDPDPFPFWHSSQKKDPGLNLALYDNEKVDKLLADARQTTDEAARAQKYQEFQKILTSDIPALFLYSPTYLYPVNKKVKGIEVKNIIMPSHRFSGIENWYINTKRVW